tara:strand:+ start:758 stop:1777 length:1020 start_codon:yes stop_codon:yes gene_type:complete
MSRERKLIKYILARLALIPVMLWLISSFVFILLRIAPGDPVDALLGSRASESARIALRAKLGLDKSIWLQYYEYINQLIHLNLGKALINQESVNLIISKSLPATIELAVFSLLIAIIIGVIVGFSGIAKREGKIDVFGRLFGISTYALPPFWAAMISQLIFAVVLGWFPVGGRFPISIEQPQGTGFLIIDSIMQLNLEALNGAIRHLLLPSMVLGFLLSGIFSRTLRLSLSKSLNDEHIEASRSRGIRERELIIKHALPNALLPVLTIMGLTLTSLIGGALLIEITFSWPGIALRLQEAITQRDYPVVQGIVVIISSLIVIISVTFDVIISIIDPRISY